MPPPLCQDCTYPPFCCWQRRRHSGRACGRFPMESKSSSPAALNRPTLIARLYLSLCPCSWPIGGVAQPCACRISVSFARGNCHTHTRRHRHIRTSAWFQSFASLNRWAWALRHVFHFPFSNFTLSCCYIRYMKAWEVNYTIRCVSMFKYIENR